MRKFTIKMTRQDYESKYIKGIRLNAISLDQLEIINTDDSNDAVYYNEKIIDDIIKKISQYIKDTEETNPNSAYIGYFKSIKFEKVEESGQYIDFENYINSDNANERYYDKHDGLYLLKLNTGDIVTAELNWYQGYGNNYRFESNYDNNIQYFGDDIKQIAFLGE